MRTFSKQVKHPSDILLGMASLLFEDSCAKPLYVSALGRVFAGGFEKAHPRFGILDSDGLFSSLDTHTALLVHFDSRSLFQALALGYEDSRETRIARLENDVEERLYLVSASNGKHVRRVQIFSPPIR